MLRCKIWSDGKNTGRIAAHHGLGWYMSGSEHRHDKVATFPETPQAAAITQELGKIHGLLSDEFPNARHISLEFHGKLVAHIDLRNKAELDLAEARLPFLGGGHLFSDLRRGNTPLHPFHHRITVTVAR